MGCEGNCVYGTMSERTREIILTGRIKMDEYRDPYNAEENRTQDTTGQNYDSEYQYQYDDRIPPEPKKRKTKMPGAIKLVIGLCIALVVLVIVFIAVAVIGGMKYSSHLSTDYSEYFDDDDDYDYNYHSDGDYEPDESDSYYEEITDATTADLSYEVLWHSEDIYPDDNNQENEGNTSYVYPELIGEDQTKLNKINDRVRTMVQTFETEYKNAEYCGMQGYVTYMTENRLSIVFETYTNESRKYREWLQAVTFDMETGEEISFGELLPVDEMTALRFRQQSKKQNGDIPWLNKMSDETLQNALQDQQVVFLTPVGTELGLNAEDGWVTVTFKGESL